MTLLESFLLALALCVDSLVVSTTCAMKSKMSYSRGLLLAVTFALFQGGFPLIGALIGNAFLSAIESVDHWIAFALLAAVGIKMIIDGFRSGDDQKVLDISRYWVICTLAVATSIDAFVVGIGFGMNASVARILLTVLIIFAVTFIVSLIGITLGKQNIPVPEKWASAVAGLVLIGLGVKTLLEHGVF